MVKIHGQTLGMVNTRKHESRDERPKGEWAWSNNMWVLDGGYKEKNIVHPVTHYSVKQDILDRTDR